MGYEGNERRRHRVFTTRNTEYHLRDDVCVAVRDRRTNRFQAAHIALHRKLEGGVQIFTNGAVVPNVREPRAGDAIYFTERHPTGEERQIVTSRVVSIERPPREVVRTYPLG